MFQGCTALTALTLPGKLKGIGESAFSHCTSLSSLALPDTLEQIGDYAFNGCKSLTQLELPPSVKFSTYSFSGSGLMAADWLPASFEGAKSVSGSLGLLDREGIRIAALISRYDIAYAGYDTAYAGHWTEVYDLLSDDQKTVFPGEADYVLYRCVTYEQRHDYVISGTNTMSNNVFNTRTTVYLIGKDGTVYKLWSKLTYPPTKGLGRLEGAIPDTEEIWNAIRNKL